MWLRLDIEKDGVKESGYKSARQKRNSPHEPLLTTTIFVSIV